jgi:REP element-mobilizing transposase RayT
MSNHVHLIVSAKEGHNLSDILRDLKKYTSKSLLKSIDQPRESRRRWLMWLFRSNGKKNSNNEIFQVWQQDNHPVQLSTAEMMLQRLEYLHNNPVKEGYVWNPEDYPYSSAPTYAGKKGLLEVEFLI